MQRVVCWRELGGARLISNVRNWCVFLVLSFEHRVGEMSRRKRTPWISLCTVRCVSSCSQVPRVLANQGSLGVSGPVICQILMCGNGKGWEQVYIVDVGKSGWMSLTSREDCNGEHRLHNKSAEWTVMRCSPAESNGSWTGFITILLYRILLSKRMNLYPHGKEMCAYIMTPSWGKAGIWPTIEI